MINMSNSNILPFDQNMRPITVSPYIDFSGLATPSNTVDTPQPFKMVVVTAPGTVTWLNFNGDSQITYCGIPGQPYYIRGKRIMATGTTATGIYWGGGQ